GPERKEAAKSLIGLMFAGVAAVLLVYMLLAVQFEDLILPFIVILTVVAALTGVSLVLFLTATPWSIVSGMGGVLLAGLVVNNGIILIDHFEKHRKDGNLEEVLREGVALRLEPIMNTVATTILGLLPAALSIPGPSPQQAMAIAVIGGLVGATLLSILVIPNAYAWLRK
ncbi:MAG: efflux RND transporter permease subunit, partial [Leptospiraceae bacterium]|nr:efflux RND transporter permease subunit [Leptospiraceae bacterium]